MTDGIIQPILLKYRINIQCAYSPEEIEYYFNQMKQELIEETRQIIEKEIDEHFSSIESCCIRDSELLQKLIGDI